MKISIITVTYNSAKTIADTIRSINEQTYPNIEHIIIDGSSKDNTLDIINNISNRVCKIVSEPDKGIYDAMNKGITLATGDVIGILNSDDFYASPDVISKIITTFEKGDCDAVYGDLDYVDSKNVSKIVRFWKAKEYKKRAFFRGWHPPHPTFFVKKEMYQKFGKFNLKYKIAADYELMLRFIAKEKIRTRYISEVLVKMRTGGESNQNLKNIITANRESYEAWKDNGLYINPIAFMRKPLSKILQYIKK